MKTELVTTLTRKTMNLLSSTAARHGRAAAHLVDIEITERLDEKPVVLETIGRGEWAIQQGRVFSHNKAKKRMARWLKCIGCGAGREVV